MKQNTHPDNYRLVVFKDTSCDYAFLTKSTVETKETIRWDVEMNIHYVKLRFLINLIPFSLENRT